MASQQPRLIPTPEEFDAQLESLRELESIDARVRGMEQDAIERSLLDLRRAELIRQVDGWTRRFAPDRDDVEGHVLHVQIA